MREVLGVLDEAACFVVVMRFGRVEEANFGGGAFGIFCNWIE